MLHSSLSMKKVVGNLTDFKIDRFFEGATKRVHMKKIQPKDEEEPKREKD